MICLFFIFDWKKKTTQNEWLINNQLLTAVVFMGFVSFYFVYVLVFSSDNSFFWQTEKIHLKKCFPNKINHLNERDIEWVQYIQQVKISFYFLRIYVRVCVYELLAVFLFLSPIISSSLSSFNIINSIEIFSCAPPIHLRFLAHNWPTSMKLEIELWVYENFFVFLHFNRFPSENVWIYFRILWQLSTWIFKRFKQKAWNKLLGIMVGLRNQLPQMWIRSKKSKCET